MLGMTDKCGYDSTLRHQNYSNCAYCSVDVVMPGDESAYPDKGKNAPGVGKYRKQRCEETRPMMGSSKCQQAGNEIKNLDMRGDIMTNQINLR